MNRHRGELASSSVSLKDNRTCFFNFKENRTHDVFLNIAISVPMSSDYEHNPSFKRHSIMLFEPILHEFFPTVQTALSALMQRQDFYKKLIDTEHRFYNISSAKKRNWQAVIEEQNTISSKFQMDSLHISYYDAPSFATGLEDAEQLWRAMRWQRAQEKQQANTLSRNPANKIVLNKNKKFLIKKKP